MMFGKLLPNVIRLGYWRQMGQELSLVWALVRDPRVPIYTKAIPVVVAIYLVVPVDLIPGFLPVIGQLDDLAILMLGLRAFTYLAPKDVVAELQAKKDTDLKLLAS